MGKVTDHVLALVEKQVRDRGIVVWYDPDKTYSGIVEKLARDGTTILQLGDSFFELRERLEPFLEFVDHSGHAKPESLAPPRLVAYLPRNRRDAAYALIEIESAGCVLEPGADARERNTRLKTIAEQVFRDIAPARAESIAHNVEKGLLTLDELDRLADQATTIASGSLQIIFGSLPAAEIALLFAASEKHDATILARQALPDLCALLQSELGIALPSLSETAKVRSALRRVLLVGELLSALPDSEHPRELELPLPAQLLDTCRKLCEAWRNRLDLRESYAGAARTVEDEMRIRHLPLRASSLTHVQTFPCIEKILLQMAEKTVLGGLPAEVFQLVEARKTSFWCAQEPTNQLRWSILETAARVLVTAEQIRTDLKSTKRDPSAMVQSYVRGEIPWFRLDTYYRHLEREYTTFELEISGEHDSIEQILSRARQQYTEVIGRCAEAFGVALESRDFDLQEFMQQKRVYSALVTPKKASGRVAYLWVDAMRYEMGHELVEGLAEDFEVTLQPGIAQLPGITEVGMAALVPNAETEMELVTAGTGKVGIRIGNSVLKDRPTRVRYLREAAGGVVADLKLNDLLKPSRKLREAISGADLVLVTSQEIDRRGEESEDEDEARRYISEVLEKLRKGIRRLASLGVHQIVVTADHGHLHGEPLESGMKIDPPGGQTVDLHRRVWIGKGGAPGDGYLRFPAARLGLAGELELAFPRGLACFKAKGAPEAFFHGGLSLQEMVIPIIVLKTRQAVAATEGPGAVSLSIERPKITTRFFSVTAIYSITGLFGSDERRVRFVVRSDRKEVGNAVMAAYGFETGTQEIILRRDKPDVVTLMLTGDSGVKSVSVHVVDAATQAELGRVDNIEVAISI